MAKKKEDVDSLVEEAAEEFGLCEKCGVPVIQGMCNCKRIEEAKKAEEEAVTDVEEAEAATPADLLAKLPGAPDQAVLDSWKARYSAVYIMPFSETEMYVWRPLSRTEFQQFMANQELAEREQLFQETLVQKAVLWPRLGPEQIAVSRAGFVSTMYQVIMQGSYFLPPELALALVVEV